MTSTQIIIAQLLANTIRYFLFAGVAYLIFYKINRSKWLHRKIQERYPEAKQIQREISNSFVSILIFSLVGMVIFAMNQAHLTQMYRDIALHGWGYFVVSLLGLLLWHDTYFYWSHRILHHPKLYRFHATHHHSHNTTPFTSFSFHPVEALSQVGFVVIVFIVPINVWAMAVAMTMQMFFNVAGHLGFEIFPAKFHQSLVGQYFNTVTHHNMHHRFNKQNFGLYFNFWDKLMNTTHKDYEQQYQTNVNKMFNSKKNYHEIS